MISEDLEFSISQYLDGTLSQAERMTLERRLESDAEARAALEGYRRLDGMLKSVPLPEVRWEEFAASISGAIDAQEEQAANAYRMPAWVRTARVILPMALAASVMIMTGVGLRMYWGHSSDNRPMAHAVIPGPGPQVASAEIASIIVVGPQDAKPQAASEIEVAIGPGKAEEGEVSLAHYSDDITSRPSHMAIASGVIPAHDRLSIPIDIQ